MGQGGINGKLQGRDLLSCLKGEAAEVVKAWDAEGWDSLG